ncbi:MULTISPECIES: hypothetical protein [unclassified Microbacterium]|uniref:hypothetical protein n=1 Tax=unclassified Microbacterium TaxID=2609290 RepID=UPI000EAA4713|nr:MULTISPECIES: hypothetical protein [unclassified Microbacterium]MBT2483366.1 hypothetical protein [Microbacterium sp. ISL-108]RKN66398.1 hypothetical protein D7252_01490 [Microbacterium sp. CGR2]
MTKEAPGAAGTAAEGEDQKPAKDSIWGKATRRARAGAATPGTIAADRRVAIADGADCEATIHQRPRQSTSTRRVARITDAVVGLPMIVRRTTVGRRALVWRTADGKWWRKGGVVQIRQQSSGERAFVLTLFKGANAQDAQFLTDIVRDARNGIALELWSRTEAEWADEMTFLFDSSRPYCDPYTSHDYSAPAEVCAEPLCRHPWHGEAEIVHELDSVGGEAYSITICRLDYEEEWYVDVDVHQSDFSPSQLLGFVNDLQWMRAECEKTNATKIKEQE